MTKRPIEFIEGSHQGFAEELGHDAQIAAIAIVHHAAVWTCNLSDFKRASRADCLLGRNGEASFSRVVFQAEVLLSTDTE